MQNYMEEAAGADRQPHGLLVLRTLAMPKDCNPSGDIFGGWILSQVDIGLESGSVIQAAEGLAIWPNLIYTIP